MDDSQIFAAVAEERRALADLFEGLSPEQLATRSLCGAWTVQDLNAHLVVPLITPMSGFAIAMVKALGNFDRANRAMTANVVREHGPRLPAILRERATSRFTPPGNGAMAPLTDVVVHGQDVRRPLGLTRTFDPERLGTVLDYLVTPQAARGFTRRGIADGITLQATDLEWSHGAGPVVSGTGEALMMALTGRAVAVTELTGEGLAAFTRP